MRIRYIKAVLLALCGCSMFIGMSGCQKPDEPAAAAQPVVEEMKEEAAEPAVEHPADAKPKDHPAH